MRVLSYVEGNLTALKLILAPKAAGNPKFLYSYDKPALF